MRKSLLLIAAFAACGLGVHPGLAATDPATLDADLAKGATASMDTVVVGTYRGVQLSLGQQFYKTDADPAAIVLAVRDGVKASITTLSADSSSDPVREDIRTKLIANLTDAQADLTDFASAMAEAKTAGSWDSKAIELSAKISKFKAITQDVLQPVMYSTSFENAAPALCDYVDWTTFSFGALAMAETSTHVILVAPSTVADRIGLKADDTLISVNGENVSTMSDAKIKLLSLAGKHIQMVVTRAGQPVTLEVDVPGTSDIQPTIRPIDAADINPAFILSPADAGKAIDKGRTMAKQGKSFQDLVAKDSQNPRGVKGEKGKSHESSVICYTLDGMSLVESAFDAANKYEPLLGEDADRKLGINYQSILFDVSLISVPKVAVNIFQTNRSAAPDDVSVIKFVLTDDKGDIINQSDEHDIGGVQSGEETFSGVAVIPHTDTSHTNSTANATIYGNGGTATGYGTGTSTTTTHWNEYVPWSQEHPYYSARYFVQFPLYDNYGSPLLGKDIKHITLHIVTSKGEMDTDYDLSPPQLK